jgi:hypothetical protein
VRAHVEAQISLVAAGQAAKAAVVAHTLGQFRAKFQYLVAKVCWLLTQRHKRSCAMLFACEVWSGLGG